MKYSYLLLTLAAFGLSSCAGLDGAAIMGLNATGIIATPPPADTADQIPQHESWCYSTMGDPQCFAQVQDTVPERLINVDPQSVYPVDLHAYHQALMGRSGTVVATETTTVTTIQPAATPVIVQPAAAPPVVVAPVAARPVIVRPAAAPPVVLAPAADVQSEKETLKDELDDDDAPEPVIAPGNPLAP
jgi:hypothetical protein